MEGLEGLEGNLTSTGHHGHLGGPGLAGGLGLGQEQLQCPGRPHLKQALGN